MAKVLGALAAALFVPAMLTAAPGEPDGKDLVGQYEITSGEKDGEPILEERLKDSGVTITEDTFAVVDREKKELYSAKYKLTKVEGEKGIWQIDMESKVPKEGAKAAGLLKRDGEEVWLIYALSGKRPEGFEKTERGQHLFKMKRSAEAADVEDDGEENADS